MRLGFPATRSSSRRGSSPTFPVGSWTNIRVRQVDRTIKISVDGNTANPIVTYTDNDPQKGPFLPYGAIGLYNEDAHVHFDNVVVEGDEIGPNVAHAAFGELTSAPVEGVQGTITPPAWSFSTIPATGKRFRVSTMLNAFSKSPASWLQAGHETSYSDAGAATSRWYWERRTSSNYTRTKISVGSGSSFSIRRFSDCGSGAPCWKNFRGTSLIATCCNNLPEFQASDEVSAGAECLWTDGRTACPATGSTGISALKFFKAGSWVDWGGQDAACVNRGRLARGRWDTASSITVGYNVTLASPQVVAGCS